jgi:elongation factor Ts
VVRGFLDLEIKAELVKELRGKTGAGIMDCKRALQESGGDLDKAVDYLKTKGILKAERRSGKAVKEGRIGIYLHRPGEQIGVIVEVNCETDFVARTEEFAALVRDLAMHIAASNPVYISREDVPEEVRAREEEIYRAQAREAGKPDKVLDKIAQGKMEKYYSDVCLLEQRFIKNPDITIEELIRDMIARTGENIAVRRFCRFQMGEKL